MVHMIHKYTLLSYKVVFAFQRNARFSKFSSKNIFSIGKMELRSRKIETCNNKVIFAIRISIIKSLFEL